VVQFYTGFCLFCAGLEPLNLVASIFFVASIGHFFVNKRRFLLKSKKSCKLKW